MGGGGYRYVMLLYVYAVRNGFEAGKIYYEVHWKGWVPFGAQKKSRFPGPTPSNAPSNGFAPPQNHYVRYRAE
jgi:hypothetical protein